MKKFLSILLMLALMLSFSTSIVHAQDGDPKDPGETPTVTTTDDGAQVPITADEAMAILVALIVLGLFNERGTQLVKQILKLIPHPWFKIEGDKTFILCGVLSILAAFLLKIDVTHYAKMFDNMGTFMPKLVNALLLMSAANTEHNVFKSLKESASVKK